MANINDWLTAPAEAEGLSEAALAERSGIALSTLRRRRRRAIDVTMGELLGLSEALNQDPGDFAPVVIDAAMPFHAARRVDAGVSTGGHSGSPAGSNGAAS